MRKNLYFTKLQTCAKSQNFIPTLLTVNELACGLYITKIINNSQQTLQNWEQ